MPSMRLETIHLAAIDFSINEGFNPEKSVGELNLDISTKNSYKEGDRISIVEVCAALAPEKNTDNNVPFFFNAKMRGVFKFEEGFDEDMLEKYQNINCPAIIFPYLRETVSDIVRRGGLQPLYLPVVNFVEFCKKSKEEIE